MTVAQLIEALKKCDPEAKVEVDSFFERAELSSIKSTFYNTPSNKYVVLFSGLSDEAPEKFQKLQEQVEFTKSDLKKILRRFEK